MDRRKFLKSIRSSTVSPGTTGLTPYSGDWTYKEASHLLKRACFGAKKTDVDYLLTLDPLTAVDELLNATAAPQPPVRDYGLLQDENGGLHDDAGVAIGETWIDDMNDSSFSEIQLAINDRRVQSLRQWWVGLMLNQGRSIEEKMVLFWHHHFSVQISEIRNCTMIWRHHKLLRDAAIGDVRQLVKDVCIDPAMLIHLNGYLNSKEAPDENFARELQELFTVGKGPGSGYTENDVIAAAKALTGWRIDPISYLPYLDTENHDNSSKSFSSFYAGTTISGSNSGSTEVDALIDMIFSSRECARFICRKIYSFFVYYQIDSNVESLIIEPLADIFIAGNFMIKPVLEALFKSEHFFDSANQACYIKSPFDFILGCMREFDVNTPAYNDYINGYPLFFSLYNEAAEMQQDLFQPPDVSGWPAYYQDPMFYEMWVHSNSLPKRANFSNKLVEGKIIDVRSFTNMLSNPADPNQLIIDATSILLQYPLSDTARNWVKAKFLTQGSGSDSSWTNAWNSGDNTYINTALDSMYAFLMNLPEYHLS